jgi:hypothetical protein
MAFIPALGVGLTMSGLTAGATITSTLSSNSPIRQADANVISAHILNASQSLPRYEPVHVFNACNPTSTSTFNYIKPNPFR